MAGYTDRATWLGVQISMRRAACVARREIEKRKASMFSTTTIRRMDRRAEYTD